MASNVRRAVQQTAIAAEGASPKPLVLCAFRKSDNSISVELPAPFLVDRISANAGLVSYVFHLEGRSRHRIEQILVELQVNSNTYTDHRFVDVPSISVERASVDDVLLIRFSGVVNNEQWEGLSTRVNFVRNKTEDDLNRYMLRILNRDMPKELAQSCLCSRGAGFGILLVAMMARGGIAAELGEAMEHGMHRFSLEVNFVMGIHDPKP